MKKIKLSKILSKFNTKELFIPDEINLDSFDFFVEKTSQGMFEFFGYQKKGNKILILEESFFIFFNDLSRDEQKKGIQNFLESNIVLVIFSDNIKDKKILNEFKILNVPILSSKLKTIELTSLLDPYIIEHIQDSTRLHGSMLSIYGEGVIIMGESGIGKSEATLELIKKNHLFVGDDAIDIINYANRLIGSSPKATREFLEVRGVGLVNIKRTYGISAFKRFEYVNLIIELINLENVRTTIDRLGNKIQYKKIKDIDVPIIQIPISSGRNVSDIIETAVMVFKQKKYDNYSAIDELNENIKKY